MRVISITMELFFRLKVLIIHIKVRMYIINISKFTLNIVKFFIGFDTLFLADFCGDFQNEATSLCVSK